MRALVLLKQFVELGHWAVDAALLVGIFPYVLKLMTHHQLVREQTVRREERARERENEREKATASVEYYFLLVVEVNRSVSQGFRGFRAFRNACLRVG